MGRPSKITLDAAIKTLQLYKENRHRFIKMRKHLILAKRHLDIFLELRTVTRRFLG